MHQNENERSLNRQHCCLGMLFRGALPEFFADQLLLKVEEKPDTTFPPLEESVLREESIDAVNQKGNYNDQENEISNGSLPNRYQ